MTTAQLACLMQEDRLYRALKDNKDNYTINSKGQVTLKPDYVKKELDKVLKKLKDINVQVG